MSSRHSRQINRLTKEIADHRKADAAEAKKDADLLAKLNRANEASSRSTSASTLQSKARYAECAAKDLAAFPFAQPFLSTIQRYREFT